MDTRANSATSRVAAKFKLLRGMLKRLSNGLQKFKQQLKHSNEILMIMDNLEENRALYTIERNSRDILKKHILEILQNQKDY
jgi:hypothetical protein